MKKVISSILLCLLMWAGYSHAEPAIDEATLRGISAELVQAAKDGDMGPFRKYLYEGSKITIDLDPSPSAGQMEVPYSDYMPLLEMAMPLMKNAEIHTEILSTRVDEAKNQGTIREKTTATVEMMGVKVRDVSVSESTYGLVNGQIKLIESSDQLISSEPVQ